MSLTRLIKTIKSSTQQSVSTKEHLGEADWWVLLLMFYSVWCTFSVIYKIWSL